MRQASVETPSARLPTVSFRSLQRATRTVEDFCRTYLIFMGLAWQDVFFQLLPTLVFVEATIYHIDEANEQAPPLPRTRSSPKACEQGGADSARAPSAHADSAAEWLTGEARQIWTALVRVLREQGLWSDDIARELRCGLEYWHLERLLKLAPPPPSPPPPARHRLAEGGAGGEGQGKDCRARRDADLLGPGRLSDCTGGLQVLDGQGGQGVRLTEALQGVRLSEALILCAVGHKSFDYRVLNLVTHRLLKKEAEVQHQAFLRCSELLTEIEDDLTDYEEDVGRDSFNTFRLYIKLFGVAHAPAALAARISSLEAQLHALSQKLPPHLAQAFDARCRDAMAAAGPGATRYTIPPPMSDQEEEAFRRGLQQTAC
eukprot:Tamp_19844.p1 GENE.Tamp_19844~~Tamp_19844.p1  ORF type:complete len:380 (+),score=74.20 Tamp_19844:23-1141(+)